MDAQNQKIPESKLTPCHPLKEISPGLLQKQPNAQARGNTFYNSALQNGPNRQKRESPIIVPNVIRPGQNTIQGHHGAMKTGGTPQSVVSRASYASPYNNAHVLGKNTKFAPVGVNSGRIFHGRAQQQHQLHGNGMPQPSSGMFATPNKTGAENPQCISKDVADAFLNLFKPSNDNVMGGIMQTPSFFDAKHRFRAEPLNASKQLGQSNQHLGTPSVQKDQASSKHRISSVFSPIPCQPQSTCSIFGVRGENNVPHSPFNRGAQERPTPKKSPINTEKILRQVAQATQGQSLQIFQQGSKMSSIGQRITPGQLLITAQPQEQAQRGDDRTKLQSRGSPKNPAASSTYKLFQGKVNTGFLKKFPAKPQETKVQPDNGSNFLKGLTATSPNPGKQQNVINIFTQQVSCSNFYPSCNGDSESRCGHRGRCEACITCNKCQRCESCQKAHEVAKCVDGQPCPPAAAFTKKIPQGSFCDLNSINSA